MDGRPRLPSTRMTHLRHWLCTAAMDLMPVRPLSKYSFEALGYRSLELGGGYERREFITLLGSAVAWPFAARAQQATMPVIGFLRSTSLSAVSTPMVTGFRQGLTVAGFTEDQNVAIEYRYADNQPERLPGLVAELIRLPVAVIVANTTSRRSRPRLPP